MIDILLVSTVVVVAMVLFATERLRVDLIALLIMSTLMLIGVFRRRSATSGSIQATRC